MTHKIKHDIESRSDIEKLIVYFYQKVTINPVIGFIFSEVVDMDWEHHVPVIVDFWETILLDNPVYQKNAMEVHYHLNKKIALESNYFETWLSLFYSTVDELYEGKIANLAKTRAKSIAAVMLVKMESINNKKSLT
ncbi:MAG: group III truncated hemoglobin [Ferruginibacter sp.]